LGSVLQQIAVQTAGFSGAGDVARPDIQAVLLFAVDAQLLEPFLQPLPVLLAGLFGEDGGLRVFLGVALEDAGGDEEGGVVCGVNQRIKCSADGAACCSCSGGIGCISTGAGGVCTSDATGICVGSISVIRSTTRQGRISMLASLERLSLKWEPVFGQKTRQNKNLERLNA